MTRTHPSWTLLATCALLSSALVGVHCDLNPQPLPPENGSGFMVGTPVASPAQDAGGEDASGGFNFGGDGGVLEISDAGGGATVEPDAQRDASASSEASADASDAGAAEASADGEATCECAEGGE